MDHIFQDDFLGGFLSFCIRSGFSKDASIRIFQKFARTNFASTMEDYLDCVLVKAAYGDYAMPEPIKGPEEINPEEYKRQMTTMKSTAEPQLAGTSAQQRFNKIQGATPGMSREEYLANLNDVSTGRAGMADTNAQWWKGLKGPRGENTNDLMNLGRRAGNWYDRTFSTTGWGGDMAPAKINAREEGAADYAAGPGGNEVVEHERGQRANYQKMTGLTPDEGERLEGQTQTLGGMSPENYNKRLQQMRKYQQGGGGMAPGYNWSPYNTVAYPGMGMSYGSGLNPMSYGNQY